MSFAPEGGDLDRFDDLALPHLHLRQAGAVLHVAIDNPPVNALSASLMWELRALLDRLREDASVTVVVFESANTDYFIAHVDMRLGEQLEQLNELAELAPEGVNVFQSMGELLRDQPQVTIVKLAGIARGGGAEFVAAADMTFAAIESARIGQVESLMGIVPSGGGTQYLAERVGRNRALELVLRGDAVDAVTAAQYGWINRAIRADELDDYVSELARRIGALPPGVAAAAKRVLAPVRHVDGFAREEHEWSMLIGRQATVHLMSESLRRGAQTPDGEQDLEGLLRQIAYEDASEEEDPSEG